MIWLLWKLITLPIRLTVGSTKLGVMTGYRTGRLLGYRRLFVFGLGVGVGMLLAPVPGRVLRAKLQERLAGAGGGAGRGGGDLTERVRFELSHSPRTWHLPQPDVSVIGERVVLRGRVPHEEGRADLVAAAAAVAGVGHVDDQLAVGAPSA
jgi:hypothetical protein